MVRCKGADFCYLLNHTVKLELRSTFATEKKSFYPNGFYILEHLCDC